ncbi:hypothetical protein AC579_6318 [Pseudocercospora musae]|uniref:Uncharacterized protein n=1 Tax=Pseudocercospora musae TaxID=113226 RepID=A0A139IPS8_9PEZI|nr:hypothetical protein AC579_6318 [Pseudocercospora musae]
MRPTNLDSFGYCLPNKIYGLLSFMSPAIRERLQVDYSQPLLSVLARYANIYDVLSVEGFPAASEDNCIAGSLSNMLRSIEALIEEFEHASSRFESDLDAFVDPLPAYLFVDR